MRAPLAVPGLLVALALAAPALGGGAEPTVAARPAPLLSAPPLPDRPVREVRLAAAPDGALVLAVIADVGVYSSGRGTFTGREVTAWRLRDGAWAPLGGSLNYDRPRPVSNLDLALDAAGTPVLVWNENYGDNDIVVFRGLQGDAWADWRTRYLGDDLPYAARTRAVAARNGEPVVAWGEYLRKPYGSQLTVRTWDGASWARGPRFNDLALFSRTPALALDRAGRPTVAWLTGEVLASNVLAARWDGAAWRPLGASLNRRPGNYVAGTRLALDREDRPTVAWLEDAGGRDTLVAKRWDGGRWAPLGDRVGDGFASAPSLALDAAGRAVLAWVDERDGRGRVRLARWAGAAWRDLGVQNVDARRDARSPSVAVEPSGAVVLAWREDDGGVYRLRLRRLGP